VRLGFDLTLQYSYSPHPLNRHSLLASAISVLGGPSASLSPVRQFLYIAVLQLCMHLIRIYRKAAVPGQKQRAWFYNALHAAAACCALRVILLDLSEWASSQ
jgi:hypothetical protein